MRFDWTVVGAGPAGIAAVGQLLDAKVTPEKIAWIDPQFKVGDFGTAWKRITSNTSVDSFLKFYRAFESFQFDKPHKPFLIERLKPEKNCPLMLAAEPLFKITETFKSQVQALQNTVIAMQQIPYGWKITLTTQAIESRKVILALGGEALTLPYPNLETISLKNALDFPTLQSQVSEHDVIAVFGSYQSARSVQENLAKTKVKRVMHFYRNERSFNTHIASLPLDERVVHYPINANILLEHIPRCHKAIYAIGFTRRIIPILGLPNDFSYDSDSGKIAPFLYGLGMAFPETIPYTMGRLAYKVTAIWPMGKHLKKIFPLWLAEEPPEASCHALHPLDCMEVKY